MSLHVLAYNFRRVLALLGMASIMNAIRAYARFLQRYAALWNVILLTLPKPSTTNFGLLRCVSGLRN
jgi:transposase